MNREASVLQEEFYISPKEIINNNCITGNTNHLLGRLQMAFKKAKSIDIIVSFLMESGVKSLKADLTSIFERNIPIRILTGNYLNITQPQALYMLKDIFQDKIDLRFYKNKNRSFHPKAYIFNYENSCEIFIGSSNMSASALKYGIEWNYRIDGDKNKEDVEYFKEVFEDLFLNESIIIDEEELRQYSKTWVKPKIQKEIETIKEEDSNKVVSMYEPKGAQIEALYYLKKTRKEGFNKALVVAATGIGKTYLAAFDTKEFEKILFIAHTEEILKQAIKSFKNLYPEKKAGFFTGSLKEDNVDILFATVQSLGKEKYLQSSYFDKSQFDYIIVDEFHHAVCETYQRIINYFTPKFLLGLTATPERLDNKDVFALCDYNVVYEVRLSDAINKGWLVPFRYYGIYDLYVDYSKIKHKGYKYDEKELEKALILDKRADLVLKHYFKYRSKRALGFCTSKNHAEYMSKYFKEHGVKACAVYSGKLGEHGIERSSAINKLQREELQVIFSVDMFNEGLDIPSIDLVMFLRPTESPTVFLQQLGRGLRKNKYKEYLNVLDFIGNYKSANNIPMLLSGRKNSSSKNDESVEVNQIDYPEDCIVDFDFRIMDIFKNQNELLKSKGKLVIEEFYRIEDMLKHIPTRLELFTYMDNDIYIKCKSTANTNPFNNYLKFLSERKKLNRQGEELLHTIAYKFFETLEKTSMSKSYKMPLLKAFYNNGDIKFKLSDEDIYLNFKEFYGNPSNAVDLLKDKSGENYLEWGIKEYIKVANNPKKAFLNSASEFFYLDEDKNFCLRDELKVFKDNDEFIRNFKDIIDYRIRRYYKERLNID